MRDALKINSPHPEGTGTKWSGEFNVSYQIRESQCLQNKTCDDKARRWSFEAGCRYKQGKCRTCVIIWHVGTSLYTYLVALKRQSYLTWGPSFAMCSVYIHWVQEKSTKQNIQRKQLNKGTQHNYFTVINKRRQHEKSIRIYLYIKDSIRFGIVSEKRCFLFHILCISIY